MVFDGDCLLNVVLADVLVHLLHAQRLPVLQNTTVPHHSLLTPFTSERPWISTPCVHV